MSGSATSNSAAGRRIIIERETFKECFGVRVVPAPRGLSVDRQFPSFRIAQIHAVQLKIDYGWLIVDRASKSAGA